MSGFFEILKLNISKQIPIPDSSYLFHPCEDIHQALLVANWNMTSVQLNWTLFSAHKGSIHSYFSEANINY